MVTKMAYMYASRQEQAGNRRTMFIEGFLVNRQTRKDANNDMSVCIRITIKRYRQLIG